MKPNAILDVRLVAKATLSSASRDIFGDTLGSFSAITIDPDSFARVKGGWRFNLTTLPDRGFNTPSKDEYSDYPGRIHEFTMQIPDKGDAQLVYARSRYLRDADGAQTTGLDPGDETKKHLGLDAPAAHRRGGVPPRLSLDAEGMARCADGSVYVSDEFSCSIYHCDPHGRMIGVIPAPPSITPRNGKRAHFTSDDDDPPKSGRQPNDGFEGLSLSPNGKTLFALMQSPVVQDIGDGPDAERYIRLVTYDLSRTPCPKQPAGHYVFELPLYRDGQKTKAPETNCVLALDNETVLVLARDGGGHGDRKGPRGTARPMHFKRILEAHLDPGANLAGTVFDKGTRSIWKKGKLDPNIRAIPLHPAIDIADEQALNGVGLSTRAGQSGLRQISAKWEGLALSPPLKPGGRERFLLVSNDNDFLTRDGMMPDRAYDAGVDNPNMILIYRVMIP